MTVLTVNGNSTPQQVRAFLESITSRPRTLLFMLSPEKYAALDYMETEEEDVDMVTSEASSTVSQQNGALNHANWCVVQEDN